MRKFQSTFNALTELRSMVRGEATKNIKECIGDSIGNNRTLTVGQTVRYLNTAGAVKLAKVVETVSTILEGEVLKRRNNRTDAIDLSELVNTYRIVVMNGRSDTYRRKIGTAVSKVG